MIKYKVISISCIAFTLAAMPCFAYAYVGPGAGLSAIGTFLALIAGVLVAIVGFLWFPLKRLFFKRKEKDEHENMEVKENTAEEDIKSTDKPENLA